MLKHERYGYVMNMTFNASHSMSDEAHKHSHTFNVRVVLGELDTDFALFTHIENILAEYLNKYRGKYLNECDSFRDVTPTIENMCQVFYSELSDLIFKGHEYTLVRFELGDSPTHSVSIGEKVCISSNNVLYDFDDVKLAVDRYMK